MSSSSGGDGNALPKALREVWDLRSEGMSITAIAKRIGEPEERVRWRIRRAMTVLSRPDPLGGLSKR